MITTPYSNIGRLSEAKDLGEIPMESPLMRCQNFSGDLHIIRLLQIFSCDFSYSCAAVDKISTDITSHGPSAIDELHVFQLLYELFFSVAAHCCCGANVNTIHWLLNFALKCNVKIHSSKMRTWLMFNVALTDRLWLIEWNCFICASTNDFRKCFVVNKVMLLLIWTFF